MDAVLEQFGRIERADPVEVEIETREALTVGKGVTLDAPDAHAVEADNLEVCQAQVGRVVVEPVDPLDGVLLEFDRVEAVGQAASQSGLALLFLIHESPTDRYCFHELESALANVFMS